MKNAPESSTLPLGKYGAMHKAFLKKHKPKVYRELVSLGKLHYICSGIDDTAATILATIPDREVAHEVILCELVYN